MPLRDGREHLPAQRALVPPPRRGGDIEDEGRALLHQLFDRIDVIEAILPEALVIPGVLANGERHRRAVEMAQALPRRGSEVSLLVEDVVVGQQHLRLHKLNVSVAHQGG